ncbi:mitochondrial glycoprotein [Trichophyton violaceum]|uniref:Mitochondrial glycoprotein n=1 Tax=Trichophyton violaceum TaxID=34388 RepID=A0A178FGK9_TRIVO|nr:mitochondrial glycoprotein [Trichophyton violaceum]
MFSIRSLTRSVPRTLSRSIATSAARPLQRSAFFQPTWKLMSRPSYAPFSTSGPRFEAAGQVDVELAAKFQEELALETESGETEELPESVKYFLDNGPFEIIDKAGEEEVVLTRKFGDENIRVSFTIADLQNINPEEDFADSALQEELEMDQSRSNKDASPEENIDEQPLEPGYLARVDVTIEKPGKGAMHVDAVARDGLIQIENVSYFSKAELATAETPDKEWERQSLYAGPPFGNLDEELQTLIERYLDERGIDTALASFVPDYIDFKEQREYVRWLGNLKGFVGNN